MLYIYGHFTIEITYSCRYCKYTIVPGTSYGKSPKTWGENQLEKNPPPIPANPSRRRCGPVYIRCHGDRRRGPGRFSSRHHDPNFSGANAAQCDEHVSFRNWWFVPHWSMPSSVDLKRNPLRVVIYPKCSTKQPLDFANFASGELTYPIPAWCFSIGCIDSNPLNVT